MTSLIIPLTSCRRGGCQGRTSGSQNPAVSADFARLCQGDKYADNAIIAGLSRPFVATDKTLGGQGGYPPGLRYLGIGHAARAVADCETDTPLPELQ
jgi:hypothetical protein